MPQEKRLRVACYATGSQNQEHQGIANSTVAPDSEPDQERERRRRADAYEKAILAEAARFVEHLKERGIVLRPVLDAARGFRLEVKIAPRLMREIRDREMTLCTAIVLGVRP